MQIHTVTVAQASRLISISVYISVSLLPSSLLYNLQYNHCVWSWWDSVLSVGIMSAQHTWLLVHTYTIVHNYIHCFYYSCVYKYCCGIMDV